MAVNPQLEKEYWTCHQQHLNIDAVLYQLSKINNYNKIIVWIDNRGTRLYSFKEWGYFYNHIRLFADCKKEIYGWKAPNPKWWRNPLPDIIWEKWMEKTRDYLEFIKEK